MTGKSPPQPVWTKSSPYLKLASVSSPAVVGNLLVFGDGMHQDSGGVLHCINAATSKPFWELTMPGTLIHLEGAPVVAGGKVYLGGGAAGAFCVELEKASLDGKDYDLATIAKMQEEKWKQLVVKYEEDKKKDPDFAIPPDDSQLLKFAPKKLWQKGEVKWHVDAPVNLVGDKLLVPTAYLDKEKVGERALYALNSATGETVWKKDDLAYNPWGGATVSGEIAIVPGSSIGYYYKEIKTAKGDVRAIDVKTGDLKWRKEIPTGGVVACVAVSDGLAVCTATDGKVRAFKIGDGERAWLYDCKMPVFAPPAVAGGVVYVADLASTVHAIDLKTGAVKWTLPLAKEIGVSSMAYGGITVHGGKLFLGTCNIEGPNIGKETAVVCIGSK
jgi:outer membrane protein assembly factor BamB